VGDTHTSSDIMLQREVHTANYNTEREHKNIVFRPEVIATSEVT
jgi:hypothetical protein